MQKQKVRVQSVSKERLDFQKCCFASREKYRNFSAKNGIVIYGMEFIKEMKKHWTSQDQTNWEKIWLAQLGPSPNNQGGSLS